MAERGAPCPAEPDVGGPEDELAAAWDRWPGLKEHVQEVLVVFP